jgi:hypothetical protein
MLWLSLGAEESLKIPLNFLSVLSTSCVTLQPSSEPIHDDKRNTIKIPRLVVLIKYFMVCCQGICKTFRLRELIRLTMHLSSAVLADRFARITNRTIRILRKVCEGVMLALSGVMAKFATPAASALVGVRGPREDPPQVL